MVLLLFRSLTIRTLSSIGETYRSLTSYVKVNSDRKKQMALEFIWNSFIMIWSLIRKGGSFWWQWLLVIDFLLMLKWILTGKKPNGFGINLEFFHYYFIISLWSLIRKGGSSDGNGSPVIDFLCCGVSQQQQVLKCYSDIKSMPPFS